MSASVNRVARARKRVAIVTVTKLLTVVTLVSRGFKGVCVRVGALCVFVERVHVVWSVVRVRDGVRE